MPGGMPCQVRQALLDELRHCAEVLRPFLIRRAVAVPERPSAAWSMARGVMVAGWAGGLVVGALVAGWWDGSNHHEPG